MPAAQSHGDAAAAPPLGAEQDPRLGRPSAGRAAAPPQRRELIRVRRGTRIGGWPIGSGSDRQLIGPARVPQMPVQVEAEAAVGVGMRMAAGAGSRPQREADPLAGICPTRRGPGDEVYAVTVALRRVVPGQRDGQARAQQPVRGDPRHVPAQQVRSQMAEISPDLGGEFLATGTRREP